MSPELQILHLNEVTSKITVQTMVERDLDKIIVTLSRALLVSEEYEGRIKTLPERSKNLGFVEQGTPGVLVKSDVNFPRAL